MRYKHNKIKKVRHSTVYTTYTQDTVLPIRVCKKFKQDATEIAKSQGLTLSAMIRYDVLEKYYVEIENMNRMPSKPFTGDIEDMPTRSCY